MSAPADNRPATRRGRATAAGPPVPDNVRELPTADRLPRAARQVVSTGRTAIYAVTDPADPAYGLWFPGRRCSPLPFLAGVLARRDAAGTQRGVLYLLAAHAAGTRHVVTDKELAGGGWIGELAMPVPEDKSIKEAVTTVIRQMAAEMPPAEAEARWEGDRLVMPPAELLPAGYLETSGDEDAARGNWREVAELACRPSAENLALNLGAGWAAPYVRPLSRVQPVAAMFAGTGVPRRGKSTNTHAAAALYGSPIRINPVLSESSIAIGDQLAALGCLPFFRDEVHSAGWTPAQWKTYVMRTLNGAGRRRSASDGSGVVRSSREWWGFQFMSGNVDPRYGATDGVQARVVVLGDPHLPDAQTSKRIKWLLGESYGWPLRWFLADHLAPAAFREYADRAAADLTAAVNVPDGSAQTVAETLAMAVAGAELLGGVLGVPGLRVAALAAAVRVLDTLSCTLADQSVRFDDQLYEAVWSDVTGHPALWPTKSEYEDAVVGRPDAPRKAVEVHGIRHRVGGRDVVSMLVKPFKRMLEPLDLAPDQALADLRARGVLITTKKMGYQHQFRLSGLGKANAYTFLVPPDDDGDQQATPAPPATPPAAPVDGGDQAAAPDTAPPAVDEAPALPFGDEDQDHAHAPAPAPGLPAGWTLDSSRELAECERCHNGRTMVRDSAGRPAHPGHATEPAEPTPAATTAPAPIGSQRAAQRVTGTAPAELTAADLAADLAAVANIIHKTWPDATAADMAEGYRLFRDATGGVRMLGDPGFTGVQWYRWVRDRNSASARAARFRAGAGAAPDEMRSELVDSVSNGGDLYRFADHVRPVEVATGGTLVALDVSGAYLAAAASAELGHGEPRHYTAGRPIRQITGEAKWSKAPGYVRLGSAPELAVSVPAMASVTAGSWMPTPWVDFLLNPWNGRESLLAAPLDIAELIVWPRDALGKPGYGRRLNAWQGHARAARLALAHAPGLPGEYARRMLKAVYTAFLGGYLRSETYNRTELVRPDWSDMVVSVTGANLLRKVVRASVDSGAPEPVGVYRDDVWYLADEVPAAMAEYVDDRPDGALGKLKVKGIVTIGDDLAAAINIGSAYQISTALAAVRRGEA